SNSSAAGIAAGSGVPTRHINRWIGVVKAYTTRVGGGPFPTEQDNSTGERIRQVGREYGTVTGRPRRCGWFDAVAVRYSARVSGSTEISIMLLDVLSGLPELKVAVAYEKNGQRTADLPASLADFDLCRPVYESSLSRWEFRRRLSRSARTAGRPSQSPREPGRGRNARLDDRARLARFGFLRDSCIHHSEKALRSPRKDWRGSALRG